MDTFIFQNGNCITPSKIIEDGLVVIEDGKIVSVGKKSKSSIPKNANVINAEGKYISPGFIDIQINGGEGSDTLDGTFAAIKQIVDFHLKNGVTGILLTLVSASIDKTLDVLKSIREFKQKNSLGKFILGAHIEGPYISLSQLGAHNPKFITKPNETDCKKYLEYLDIIKIFTQAPEIPGVIELCSELINHGVIASIGHSDATFEEVKKAVNVGFSMVTHIYSAMSSVKRSGLKKVPGIVEAALLFDELWVEVINDGQHVPEPLFRLVLKNKGVDKTILASDAIRAAGMQDGKYTLGSVEENHLILVENGIAMTVDKKLYAGSTTTMNECVRNAIKIDGIKIEDAVAMATINPAKMLNLDNELGSLTVGKKANIIIFDEDINVSLVMQEGKIIFERKRDKNLSNNL